MKKLLAIFLLAGLVPACSFAEITAPAGGDTSGLATTADLTTKLSTNAVTQTVTTSTTEVPSGAAVTDALDLKVDITDGVATNITLYGSTTVLNASASGSVRSYYTNSVAGVGTNGVFVRVMILPTGTTNIYYSLYQ